MDCVNTWKIINRGNTRLRAVLLRRSPTRFGSVSTRTANRVICVHLSCTRVYFRRRLQRGGGRASRTSRCGAAHPRFLRIRAWRESGVICIFFTIIYGWIRFHEVFASKLYEKTGTRQENTFSRLRFRAPRPVAGTRCTTAVGETRRRNRERYKTKNLSV